MVLIKKYGNKFPDENYCVLLYEVIPWLDGFKSYCIPIKVKITFVFN